MCENQELENQNQNQNQNKIIEYDNIKYLIKEEENTAGVIGCDKNLQQILIPRSIKEETKEYDVISIMENAFNFSNIKTIQFSSESKLETIDKYAFFCSTIKSIIIPSSVTLIGEGAFYYCEQLEIIEISNDSKLQTIKKNAFWNTKIKSIIIPSSVTLIGEGAFSDCYQLETVEIPNDSKLQTIEQDAFSYSKIMKIKIPSELVDLKEEWFNFTSNLTEIIVSPNNPRYCLYDENLVLGKTKIEENNYENLIFCTRNIKHIKLPNFIKHICSFSLYHCNQLEKIEISSESKLETIDKYAFSYSTIKSIIIPSSVTLIGEGAFYYCEQLEIIEISNDSKLQTIKKNAFWNTKIKSIVIPSSVTLIGEGAFACFFNLQIIEINNSEMISISQTIFQYVSQVLLMIPFHS